MTQVTIMNTQQEPKLVKITEAEVGKWYKVHSYPYINHFDGKIGVITEINYNHCTDCEKTLVTTCGYKLYNPDFILQELTSVEISYK